MIMLSQCVHVMLVYYNIKLCFQQLNETFSLVIMRIDLQNYQCKLCYKLTILTKISVLNSELFLVINSMIALYSLAGPLVALGFNGGRVFFLFIKTSTIILQGRILLTVISHSSLSVSTKDTVSCFCSSVSNCK